MTVTETLSSSLPSRPARAQGTPGSSVLGSKGVPSCCQGIGKLCCFTQENE